MFKIDSAGSSAGQFVDRDPVNAVPGTVVAAEWLNALQNELINVLEGYGITLDKNNSSQLFDVFKTHTQVTYSSIYSAIASSINAPKLNTNSFYDGADKGGSEFYYSGSGFSPTDTSSLSTILVDLSQGYFVNQGGHRYKFSRKIRYNIYMFGALGSLADDTFAFLAASGKKVYLPPDDYACNALSLASKTQFIAEKGTVTIRPFVKTLKGALGCDSGSASVFVHGLRFKGIEFIGDVDTLGFYEQAHLAWINGAWDFEFYDCKFTGSRGDGLYIGSGPAGGDERHNRKGRLRYCEWDGVNNENRNGLSVIDCDDLEIRSPRVKNYSKATMPGSFDFEPDQSFSIIRNIKIKGGKFESCLGMWGHIAFATTNSTNVKNITIDGANFSGANSAILFNLSTTLPTGRHNLKIRNCDSDDTIVNFCYKRDGHIWGADFHNNSWAGLRGVWFSHAGATIGDDRYLKFSMNDGNATGAGSFNVLLLENSTQVSFTSNNWNTAEDAHIKFGNFGDARKIHINGDHFYGSPANGSIVHTAATSYYAAENSLLNCYFESPHGFRAYKQDFAGSVQKVFDESVLPSAFPYGRSLSAIRSGATLPDTAGDDRGLLVVERYASTADTECLQWYYATGDAADLPNNWFRKATSGTTWGAWYRVTGV